jgi:hypothetical protein
MVAEEAGMSLGWLTRGNPLYLLWGTSHVGLNQ